MRGEGAVRTDPLDVISCHSVVDAPTNSKFLDFSQLHLYFHLVKSFFTFFCNFYKKITVENFYRPDKERFFDENGQKVFFSYKYEHFYTLETHQGYVRHHLKNNGWLDIEICNSHHFLGRCFSRRSAKPGT